MVEGGWLFRAWTFFPRKFGEYWQLGLLFQASLEDFQVTCDTILLMEHKINNVTWPERYI